MSELPGPLVDADWLLRRKDDPDLRIVDASWRMPGTGPDGRTSYQSEHIEGAVFFDIEEIVDPESPLPHMAPSSIAFASAMRRLGVGDGARIVLYDRGAFLASARAWWMLRLMGHGESAVLNGGLAAWKAAGGPVSDLPTPRARRHFTARVDAGLIRDYQQMRENLVGRREQVIDARAEERFRGAVAEPRPGVRPGRIPRSRNLPYASLLTEEGRMRPVGELRAAFEAIDVELDRPIVTTCGSGVSAAVLNLALATLGRPRAAMYDGSWAEWGSKGDAPIEKG